MADDKWRDVSSASRAERKIIPSRDDEGHEFPFPHFSPLNPNTCPEPLSATAYLKNRDSEPAHPKHRSRSHSRSASSISSLLLIATERLGQETNRANALDVRCNEVFAHLRTIVEERDQLRRTLAKVQEELSLYKLQLDVAQNEIFRAQKIVDDVDKARVEAEEQAAKDRTLARQLTSERAVWVAREEGRSEGFKEGLRQGRRWAYEAARRHSDEYTDDGYEQVDGNVVEAYEPSPPRSSSSSRRHWSSPSRSAHSTPPDVASDVGNPRVLSPPRSLPAISRRTTERALPHGNSVESALLDAAASTSYASTLPQSAQQQPQRPHSPQEQPRRHESTEHRARSPPRSVRSTRPDAASYASTGTMMAPTDPTANAPSSQYHRAPYPYPLPAQQQQPQPPRPRSTQQQPPRPQSTQQQQPPRPQSTQQQQQPPRPQSTQQQPPRPQSTQQQPPRPQSTQQQQQPPRPQSTQQQPPRPQSTQQQQPLRPQSTQQLPPCPQFTQQQPPRPQSTQQQEPQAQPSQPNRSPSPRSSRPLPRAPAHLPEPIDIRTDPDHRNADADAPRPPSPTRSHRSRRSVVLPPDGIPTVGPDSFISLPAPHELSRPVSVAAESMYTYTPATERGGIDLPTSGSGRGRTRTMSNVSAVSTRLSQFDILSPPRAPEAPASISLSDQVAREWRVANADRPESRQGTTQESHGSDNFSTRSSVPRSQVSRRSGPQRRPREIVMPMPLSTAMIADDMGNVGAAPLAPLRDPYYAAAGPSYAPPPQDYSFDPNMNATRPRSAMAWLKSRFNRMPSSSSVPNIQIEPPSNPASNPSTDHTVNTILLTPDHAGMSTLPQQFIPQLAGALEGVQIQRQIHPEKGHGGNGNGNVIVLPDNELPRGFVPLSPIMPNLHTVPVLDSGVGNSAPPTAPNPNPSPQPPAYTPHDIYAVRELPRPATAAGMMTPARAQFEVEVPAGSGRARARGASIGSAMLASPTSLARPISLFSET
ncbi:hypothetical protein K438DRAFT_1960482 [Mycena galopus ATCC 62051]|nr:hypothetical protein K438DRAFT_1960482 [Mycena galopus ATCC 62051]